MTWTRLLYIKNIQTAMKRVIPDRPREQLAISKRYQAEIRKQFRINGVPWIYDLKAPKEHHRDRTPKPTKRSVAKEERLKKIQKNLAQSQKKILDFRQDRMDSRPLGGIDKLIAKTLPSHIKGDNEQLPEHMRRRKQSPKEPTKQE